MRRIHENPRINPIYREFETLGSYPEPDLAVLAQDLLVF